MKQFGFWKTLIKFVYAHPLNADGRFEGIENGSGGGIKAFKLKSGFKFF
jgi:hypothetical protein